MTTLLRALLLAATAAAGTAHATTITVTPEDLGTPAGWNVVNVRAGSAAAITGTNARSGNGSVEMALSDNGGKADFALTWGYVEGRTLGNLDALGYDWFRSAGGSATAHLQPALRLVYDADGSAATAADRGYLVWEQVYNGGGLVEERWTSSDILGGNFWMRQHSPGNTVERYNVSLAQWMSGARPGAPADVLGANTAILGLEFGIGSGWGGSFAGFVDNVGIGFRGQGTTVYNFETRSGDVPEPGSLALLGLGVAAVVAAHKRQRG